MLGSFLLKQNARGMHYICIMQEMLMKGTWHLSCWTACLCMLCSTSWAQAPASCVFTCRQLPALPCKASAAQLLPVRASQPRILASHVPGSARRQTDGPLTVCANPHGHHCRLLADI
jgi:hypothetical protein